MSYQPILIAPFKSGLIKYYKPFVIGDDAFTELENCYSWRGNIKKREGSTVLGRIVKWKTSTGITNASPPVVTAAGHGLFTGDMVFLENVLTTNGTVSTIAPGLTTVVTTTGAHGMSLNQTVVIRGIVGSIGNVLNNIVVPIIAVTGTTMTLAIDTSGLVYTSGGSVYLGNLDQLAFYVTVLTANTFSLQDLNNPSVNIAASGTAQSADIYLPIMGTRIYIQSSTGNEQLIVFTPRQAFLFNTSTQVFDNISFNIVPAAITWTGTKENFFYTSNYARVMWTTNDVDHIRFFNGSTTAGWQDFLPVVSGTTTLDETLIILPYKGRLVALNTTEGGINIFNRARWSRIGTPFAGTAAPVTITNVTAANPAVVTAAAHGFTSGQTVGIANIVGNMGTLLNNKQFVVTVLTVNTFSIPVDTTGKTYTSGGFAQLMVTPPTGFGLDVSAWRDDIPGKGGYTDADTSERIVSAEICQDTLIVGFQFSTWRLRYTGNEILPFIWERINTQYGCEGTFSVVGFDEGVMQISRRGIVMATFNDVDRIDLAIPDQVDEFETGETGEGINRIQGIRDYQKRLVYWIYGDEGQNDQTPNKVLCFNYQDNTWSIFDQSFTTLGQYKKTTDNTWSTWTTPWEGDTTTWESPLDQKNTIIIVAGAKDSRVWQMMNSEVSTDNGSNFNFRITTNLINPYFQDGRRCKLAFYDLYLTNTDIGEVTLENFTDDSDAEPWIIKTVKTNDNSISPNPTKITKYIRVFLGMIARQHQITITLSDAQLADPIIGASDFEIQGIIMHTRPGGRLKM